MKRRGWVAGHLKLCSSPFFRPSPKGTFYDPSVRYRYIIILLSTILLVLLKMVFTFPIPRTNVRSIFYITNRRRLIPELGDQIVLLGLNRLEKRWMIIK